MQYLVQHPGFKSSCVAVSVKEIHDKIEPESYNCGILFEFSVSGNFISCRIKYNTSRYSDFLIRNFSRHTENIFCQTVENYEIPLDEIKLLTEAESYDILFKRNDTKKEIDFKTVVELFYEKTREFKDRTALVDNLRNYTYGEINSITNRFARYLQSKGVTANTLVPVIFDPSAEMIIAILSIIKAGGVYVPISPSNPIARTSYILKDCNCRFLVTSGKQSLIPGVTIESLVFDQIDLSGYDDNDLAIVNKPNDAIYAIYTSGSTGTPKGVIVEHKGVFNTLTTLQKLYPLNEEDSYLLKTNYTFDVSVTEIFGWFFGCGKLVVLNKGDEKDPKRIIDSIFNNSITHINFVPSMLTVFLEVISEKDMEKLKSLKYIFVAGEAFTPTLVEKVKRLHGIRIENIYGSTEATIYATYYSLDDNSENAPIGKPLDNVFVYNLPKDLTICPDYIAGELFIGGKSIARGYLNQPELTHEKFLKNPFIEGDKIYKTGDLVKWDDKQNIDYLGRIDQQVKIRGFRIELEEIEKILGDHPEVKRCFVIKKTNGKNEDFLCAYYLSDVETDPVVLMKHITEKLPEYMCPSFFVHIDEVPMTSSGKLDRKKITGTHHKEITPDIYKTRKLSGKESCKSLGRNFRDKECRFERQLLSSGGGRFY